MASQAQAANAFWTADFAPDIAVPVARPRLPSADAVLPHLRRIDANRWYSNGGPLVREFEERLADQVRAPGAVSVANATVGLALALMAQGARPGALCMMPSWSFAASAHAARLAGLVPWLVDVEPASWALDPGQAAGWLGEAPGPVGAVMPVMPFGSPLDLAPWDAFRDATGIPVAVDAAAAFDTVRAAAVPAVVSLHATKVLGIGEGGFVASTDAGMLDAVRQRSNFGFWNSREATVTALNGKISEYAAAVGLAAFDDWPRTREGFARVARAYRTAFAATGGIALQPGFGDGWVSSTMMARLPDGTLSTAVAALAGAGIGSRLWWGGGLHRHEAFRDCPRRPVPATEALVSSVIGLPCWVDLPDDAVHRVATVVSGAIRAAAVPAG